METGTKISAIAHVSLISWALFGGTFRSEPLPMAVQDVSVISAEQFAAMTAQREAPELPTDPAELQPPAEPDEIDTPDPTPEELPEPEPVTQPEPEPEPEVEPETVEISPEPELIEQPPTLEEPEPEVAALPVPPGPEAEPNPADKIAPEQVAPPPPEAKPDDIETPAVSLDEGAETQQEQQDQTALEETAPEIVTEAEEVDNPAPRTSPRPRVRPNRPAPTPEPEITETTEPAPTEPAQNEQAINDALAEALGNGTEPSGPPLTSGEKDGLRVAVSQCWNVGSLSTDALKTVVVVAFSLTRDGKVVDGSLRMVNSSGGSDASAKQAYQTARRAILRCVRDGYDLPADKYAQWKDIEITFNPERMRIK
ncbi:Cell division and transport-associated protein TolA [Ruegeria halocynthiae]|uniref:Cell division and transport-associated protein TolA n=1 Tax=Ruegeria halocynthiae TaxID=985054 RepID=A0A1H3DG11_9RHOB|nr:energy transducer TonB [Ruegeria halocynthiae]SDX65403.1 Cell division and transport-associated protein TolA [Ruegeria halocynthiae]